MVARGGGRKPDRRWVLASTACGGFWRRIERVTDLCWRGLRGGNEVAKMRISPRGPGGSGDLPDTGLRARLRRQDGGEKEANHPLTSLNCKCKLVGSH